MTANCIQCDDIVQIIRTVTNHLANVTGMPLASSQGIHLRSDTISYPLSVWNMHTQTHTHTHEHVLGICVKGNLWKGKNSLERKHFENNFYLREKKRYSFSRDTLMVTLLCIRFAENVFPLNFCDNEKRKTNIFLKSHSLTHVNMAAILL